MIIVLGKKEIIKILVLFIRLSLLIYFINKSSRYLDLIHAIFITLSLFKLEVIKNILLFSSMITYDNIIIFAYKQNNTLKIFKHFKSNYLGKKHIIGKFAVIKTADPVSITQCF
jgi:hypothetical protein